MAACFLSFLCRQVSPTCCRVTAAVWVRYQKRAPPCSLGHFCKSKRCNMVLHISEYNGHGGKWIINWNASSRSCVSFSNDATSGLHAGNWSSKNRASCCMKGRLPESSGPSSLMDSLATAQIASSSSMTLSTALGPLGSDSSGENLAAGGVASSAAGIDKFVLATCRRARTKLLGILAVSAASFELRLPRAAALLTGALRVAGLAPPFLSPRFSQSSSYTWKTPFSCRFSRTCCSSSRFKLLRYRSILECLRALGALGASKAARSLDGCRRGDAAGLWQVSRLPARSLALEIHSELGLGSPDRPAVWCSVDRSTLTFWCLRLAKTFQKDMSPDRRRTNSSSASSTLSSEAA
uniref:Secreted protein n=1 Tax=Ixodes ricinus TaxID=34613 RepID=A0A6B0V8S5_IXORI